jgi:O-antigen/teichoic acid export membrane protein
LKPTIPRAATPFGRALANVGWLLTGKGGGALLSLAYLAMAARSLSPVPFGQFMLVLSAAQAVAALVGFQTWQIVIRYGMPLREAGRQDALGRLVRFCIVLDLGGAVLGCGIAYGAVLVMRAQLGWSPALAREAMWFSVVLLLSIRSTAVGILRLYDRFAKGVMADAVTPIMRFVGACFAVLSGASIAGFLIGWAVAEVATAAAYWIAVRRAAPGLFGRWAGAGRTPADCPGFWPFALATNANATLNAASRQFVVVLVGFVAGPAAAGSYRLAYQLSQSLVRLADLFARGIYPEYARANATATRDNLRVLFRQSARLALGAGLAICLLAPLLGQPVLWLIGGSAYLHVYPVLVLLSIAAGLEIMGVGFEPLLVATGHAGQALRIRAISVVVLFALLATLLVSHGIVVAGAAALAASGVALILFVRAARRVIAQ